MALSRIYCPGQAQVTNSRLLTGVLLFAVRTFLPPINRGTITRLIDDKGKLYFFKVKLPEIDKYGSTEENEKKQVIWFTALPAAQIAARQPHHHLF